MGTTLGDHYSAHHRVPPISFFPTSANSQISLSFLHSSTAGVGKLPSIGKIQPTCWFWNKILLEPSHKFITVSWVWLLLQQQSWVVMADTVWSAKPKNIYHLALYRKLANPWSPGGGCHMSGPRLPYLFFKMDLSFFTFIFCHYLTSDPSPHETRSVLFPAVFLIPYSGPSTQ